MPHNHKSPGTGRVITFLYLITLLFMTLNISPCQAGAGDLDPTFGNEGIVITDFGAVSNEYTQDAVMQDDGKVIVASDQTAFMRDDFALVRINPDGSLDDSFGTEGKVVTGILDDNGFYMRGFLTAIALQADRKIIAGGAARDNSIIAQYFTLVRYHPDGSLDTSFGSGGIVITDIGTPSCYAVMNDIVIQVDGRIIAAGYAHVQDENGYCSSERFAIARYNSDGSLDQTFGINGKVISDFWWGAVKKILLQPDGKIIALGERRTGGPIARYNPDGSLDDSFGEGGFVIGVSSVVNSGALQSDGKIITAGGGDACLYRYNADGTIDSSFGANGVKCISDPYKSGDALDVILDNNGRILVAGNIRTFTDTDGVWKSYGPFFSLFRYNSDGTPDTTFGSEGEVQTLFNSVSDQGWAYKVLQRQNGKIVAAGYVPINWRSDPDNIGGGYYGGDRNAYYIAVAQYEENGVLDLAFSEDGKMTLNLGGHSDDWASDVIATQADGKILIAGGVNGYYTEDFALVRYTTDGRLDETFGNDGKVQTDFRYYRGDPALDDYRSYEHINAIAIHDDGKIVAAGIVYADQPGWWQTSAFALARYNPDGTLDYSFGTDGRVVTEIDGDRPYGEAFDLVIQPDQKIVVVGYAEVVFPAGKPPQKMFITRYNYDGSLDNTFGNGGIVVTDFDPDQHDIANSVALQPDGKILVSGYTEGSYLHPERTDFAVVRFNEDGSLDESFGTDGKVRTDFGGNEDRAKSILLQSDGRILVAGYSGYDAAMARYLPDGTLDGSFGSGNGKVITQFLDRSVHLYSEINDCKLQEDGKILVAGYSGRYPDLGPGFSRPYEDFALARYNPNGNLDYTFGVGGIVNTNIGTVTIDGTDYDAPIEGAYALTIQGDGKIVVAGYTLTFINKFPYGTGYELTGHYDIVLARYEGVTTKVDQLDSLVYRVQMLAADDVLNNGQANSLQAKLRAAIQQVDRSNIKTAINQLDAFMNEVSAFINAQIISPQQGQELYEEAVAARSFLAN